jgi:hypothetical protein
MKKIVWTAPRAVVYLLLFLAVVCWTSSARAQCVDSSEVNGFTVRSVNLKALFGLVPKNLAAALDAHRGDSYSADKASEYMEEIRVFFASDPAQAKYEELIANKLKVSVKAGQTWLSCVKKVEPTECRKAFPENTQCVDVTLKRYFVDVDALNASPYLMLLPRGFAAYYGAMPKALMALNPDFDAFQDKEFGPGPSIDTVTDLLDLSKVLSSEPNATVVPPPARQVIAAEDQLTIETGSGQNLVRSEEPPVEVPERDTKLLLRIRGQKSLTERYYDAGTGLSFTRTKPFKMFQDVNIDFGFAGSRRPQGDSDFFKNTAWLDFNTNLRFESGAIRLVNVGGGYRWSRNQLFDRESRVPGELNSENSLKLRAIADGTVKRGLTRAAMWFENNSLQGPGSYQRLAALIGYGKEFVIPRKKDFHQITVPALGNRQCWTSYTDLKPKQTRKNESTVGLEVLAGMGHTWGDVPRYARFFAGSPAGQFLYDELTNANTMRFPFGPLMRSLGENQGGAGNVFGVSRGGTSYWHANVNLALPIAGWTRPLIPHDEWVGVGKRPKDDKEFAEVAQLVPEGSPICVDLKSTVKTLVRVTGQTLMISQQARDKLTEAQKKDLRLANKPNRTPEEDARLAVATAAFEKNKEEVAITVGHLFDNEILPITDFIADHANIIAVKPLLLFDVAHLGPAGTINETRYGVGGGFQVDIVMARFELGYVSTLNRAPGDPRGNFFGRLVLRRLF